MLIFKGYKWGGDMRAGRREVKHIFYLNLIDKIAIAALSIQVFYMKKHGNDIYDGGQMRRRVCLLRLHYPIRNLRRDHKGAWSM